MKSLMVILLCWGMAITPNGVQSLQNLENQANGRLGVALLNTENSKITEFNGYQRFPMCSTFKLMLVGAILKQSMQDPKLLQKQVMYSQTLIDASGYAPITKQHVKTGMTIFALCAAALDYSDNGAANLLLQEVGGPKKLTAFARFIGDQTFRLDRTEPSLNSAIPGDLRDTTTPMAMAESVDKLAFGNVLGQKEREQLQIWLKANTTGNERIRAGVPADWVVGDKTGTGDYGTTNDVGIIWPPKGPPFILVVYFTQADSDAAPNNAIIAQTARILIN